ncbi:MAG TPA: hypothetical protein PLB91_13020 [Spirochaetales bacterium]|nr:hypothetical protein [Spirochaetales bacterium]HRY54792.1 hypothetical protein [Spirochaetia bacterium]HRZ64798.1 hypothetical protein [Spirochaetia bacterium]
MRALRFLPFLLCLALVASCASAPSAAGGELSVSLRRAASSDFKNYGWGFSNPYIPFKGLILDKLLGRADLLVLVVEIEAPAKAEIQLLGAQSGQAGLDYYDRTAFTEFWDAFDGYDQDIKLRRTRIARSYFPPVPVKLGKGSSSYFIAFVGKYPLKGPFDIRADFLVNGERREVELHLD